jgi:hypothetical protein
MVAILQDRTYSCPVEEKRGESIMNEQNGAIHQDHVTSLERVEHRPQR